MLKEFIKQFTEQEVIEYDNAIAINGRYYLPLHDLPEHNRMYTGIFLGEKVKKSFKPSFMLLDMLAAYAPSIQVDDERAWLFVCGKDIFDPLTDRPENTLVLVKSNDNEVLGYGIIKNKPKYMVRNILDRGDFLRRE